MASEGDLGRKWDRCVADSAVKLGKGGTDTAEREGPGKSGGGPPGLPEPGRAAAGVSPRRGAHCPSPPQVRLRAVESPGGARGIWRIRPHGCPRRQVEPAASGLAR